MSLTVIGPRKDLTDAHRNRVQDYTRRAMGHVDYITGMDPNPGALWSMSRAINEGRTLTTADLLLITPTDYAITPHIIARCVQVLAEHPWWGPFHSVRQIPKADTLAMLRGRPDRGRGEVWPMCIPCIAVRADAFDAAGGMDPRFEGWGPEDAALRVKLGILFGDPPPPEFQAAELWSQREGVAGRDASVSMFETEYLTARTPADVAAIIERSGS